MKKIYFLFIFGMTCISSSIVNAAYKYDVAAVMLFQNEAPYLKEWLEYHKLLGVEHFYLYNDNSEDDYLPVLEPYIKKGEVELFHLKSFINKKSFNRIQKMVYTNTVKECKENVKWLLIIDSDEFVVPIGYNTISEFLTTYDNESIGGIFLRWIIFGTSYVKKIPKNSLMIELLYLNSGPSTKEKNPFRNGKSIVRPDRVNGECKAHLSFFKDPYTTYMVPLSEGRINHYWTRDLDFANRVKWPRRKNWGMSREEFVQLLEEGNQENPEYFEAILPFIAPLRQRMGFTKNN